LLEIATDVGLTEQTVGEGGAVPGRVIREGSELYEVERRLASSFGREPRVRFAPRIDEAKLHVVVAVTPSAETYLELSVFGHENVPLALPQHSECDTAEATNGTGPAEVAACQQPSKNSAQGHAKAP
jgi:hypothetical protein